MAELGYEDFTIEREPLNMLDYWKMLRSAFARTVNIPLSQRRGINWKNNLKKKAHYEYLSSPVGQHAGIVGRIGSDALNALLSGGKHMHPLTSIGIPAAYNFTRNLKNEYDNWTDPIVLKNYRQVADFKNPNEMMSPSYRKGRFERSSRSPHRD